MKEDVSTKYDSAGQNFYKIGFFVLASLFLLAVGTVGSWYYFSRKTLPVTYEPLQETTKDQVSTEVLSPTVGELQEEVEITLNPSPTIKEESDLEQIKKAMAVRHSKPVEDTIVNIGENTGSYISGGVKFAGEMGGGWFLAAKKDGKWVIVDDGNGTISCEVIEPWNFPSSLVPECVDKSGNPVKR